MAATKNINRKVGSRKSKRSWNVYIKRSLASIDKSARVSGKTLKIVNSFVNDMFERIANEAAAIVRANKKRTLGSSEIQTAVRVVLPVQLSKHAMAEGTKALKKVST